jgi:sporulation protein YlmC with PRC-barrel domain
MTVFDENAKKIGIAKQVGVDSSQSVVLIITKNDGSEIMVPWASIGKVGEVILLGSSQSSTQPINQSFKCSGCGFDNKEGSKFCENCGTKI